MAWPNPFAFRPAQVSFWTSVVYVAVLVALVSVQETLPAAPPDTSLPPGISLTEAWADLGNLTQHFHPANSRANDEVRSFLLWRIAQILDRNGAAWTAQVDRVAGVAEAEAAAVTTTTSVADTVAAADADVVVFDDMLTNVTFASRSSGGNTTAMHFQGTNVYVYIRGTEDAAGAWWQQEPSAVEQPRQLVMVNAHFDSVASSHGATDDGMGVVSALQVVRYFSAAARRPRRGVVVLLNNAEEEFLLGACAFANSALAPYVHTFVNLEGVGAGGRALLFRATDQEVVGAYGAAPHPFTSVVTSDSFKLGLIRSETDYRVWVPVLGYRGLDMAFIKPRARYHTSQDDRRHTSQASTWHMLSAALAAARALADGPAAGAVDRGQTTGVWFDLFGDSLVVFGLRGLFAWSVTLLVAAPLALALVGFFLYRNDQDYLFRASVTATAPLLAHENGVRPDEGIPETPLATPVGGWKGVFRFPLALVASLLAAFGTAFVLAKFQPFIIYSSLYAVLALMFCVFYFVFWCVMRGADAIRPSALHRTYAHLWLFALAWVILVVVSKLENENHIASGYIFVFWASSVFLATLVSLLELFALQKKTSFAGESLEVAGDADAGADGVPHDDDTDDTAGVGNDGNDGDDGDDGPTETSPLISGRRPTFTTGYRRTLWARVRRTASGGEPGTAGDAQQAFGYEQGWSKTLPTWTWLVQFLLLGPFHVVLAGQVLLTLTAAVQQTGTDGSDLLFPYLIAAAFTAVVLLPLTPFLHRVTAHVPLLALCVGAGTLIYCLAAFPFSAASPYKFYMRQTFSVDDGSTSVVLAGYEGPQGYLSQVKASLPSLLDRPWDCVPRQPLSGVLDCSMDGAGLEPRLGAAPSAAAAAAAAADRYQGLVSVNATRGAGGASFATLTINGANTKSCALVFDSPVRDVSVHGGLGWDSRFDFDPTRLPPKRDGKGDEEKDDGDNAFAVGSIILWRRDWETPWTVDVWWPAEADGVHGRAVCRWADANDAADTLPAIDEAWGYAPTWAILSLAQNPPLVQGSKSFSV